MRSIIWTETFTNPIQPNFVSPDLYGGGMSKTRRRGVKMLACPGCGQIGALRRIVYGMPDPETFDFEKYAVGGCCMNGDGSDPDVSCRECGWEGFREDL
jgi:hypothetical protein